MKQLKYVDLEATTSGGGSIVISKATYPEILQAIILTPDNSSLRIGGGTSVSWALFAYNDYNNTRLNNTAITYRLYYLE